MQARLILAVMAGGLLFSGCGDKGTEGEKEIRKWSVSGTVVRIQTSVFIPGAKVILGQDTVVTDSAGKYLFAEVLEGVYPFSVVCDSFGYYHDNINVRRDMIYDVPLVPAVRLFGKVYGHLGQAVAGAIVNVDGAEDTTDSLGSYAIPNAASGFRQITCVHPEYYPFRDTVTVPTTPMERDIHMYPAANLFGFVYGEGGLSLTGAIVSAGGMSDTSSSHGEYELKMVPLGQQTLTCAHVDYFDYSTTVAVTERPTRADVTMDNLVNLTGMVFHPVDGPIAGAEVEVAGLTDLTDANGHYEFRNVPLGQQTMTCSHPDYFAFNVVIIITTSRLVFDIQMNSQLNLMGTVYHQSDGPIEGAIVTIAGLVDTSLAGGYYQFRNVPVGEQEISCTHSQYYFEPDTIMISQSLVVYDVRMFYEVVETLYVSEDATVKWYNLSDSFAQQNYGGAGSLEVLAELFYEDLGPDPSGDIMHVSRRRIFVKLPYPQSTGQILKAELSLYCDFLYSDYSGGTQVRYVGTTSAWDEETITWISQPNVPSGGLYTSGTDYSDWRFEVTRNYLDSVTYGSTIVIVHSKDPPPQAVSWIRFVSRENVNPEFRPKVVLTFEL